MTQPMPMSGAQFREMVHKELTENAAFFKKVGVKAELSGPTDAGGARKRAAGMFLATV